VVADLDAAKAGEVARELGAEASEFDATNPDSVAQAVKGADLVFNAVGPHYRFGVPLVDAAIRAGANYVDINDDYDVAAELVRNPRYDEAAKAAGVTVLIGAGTTPGITNVLARSAADQLDHTETIAVAWAIPFIVNLSPAVVEHMFHILSGDVIEFLDGDYQLVPAGSGERLLELLPPFGTYRFAFSGHGEAVTIPKYLPGLKEVTVRSAFFQEAGNDVYRSLISLGLTDTQPLPGVGLSPVAFLTQYMCSPAADLAMAVDTSDSPQGAVFRVEAEGERAGTRTKIIYEMHHMMDASEDVPTDPTAFAASIALREVTSGRVTARGVLAPEACLEPARVVPLFLERTGMQLYRQVVQVERISRSL
jgi:saccharopine dehydrogenase-like NADP-dependent oxidoreductase